MSWGGKVTSGGVSLAALTDKLASEDVLRQGLLECAAEPCLAAMRRQLEPHRRANPSAVDAIGIVEVPSAPDTVSLVVGAFEDSDLSVKAVLRQPQTGRGFVLKFLQFGSVHQRARPWVNPALDDVLPGLPSRLHVFFKSKVSQILGGSK